MACPYSDDGPDIRFYCGVTKEYIDSSKHSRYCNLWRDFYNCPDYIEYTLKHPDTVRKEPV